MPGKAKPTGKGPKGSKGGKGGKVTGKAAAKIKGGKAATLADDKGTLMIAPTLTPTASSSSLGSLAVLPEPDEEPLPPMKSTGDAFLDSLQAAEVRDDQDRSRLQAILAGGNL